jgi:hypothetical protein
LFIQPAQAILRKLILDAIQSSHTQRIMLMLWTIRSNSVPANLSPGAANGVKVAMGFFSLSTINLRLSVVRR